MLRCHTRISTSHSLHFIPTVTDQRGSWFVKPSICTSLLELFERCRLQVEIPCLGYVLMPDHFYVLVMQTVAGVQISELMRRFKHTSSLVYRPQRYDADALWHRRFDDVPVPGPQAVAAKLNYVHLNPVKKKLSETAAGYPWSSARDYETSYSGIVKVEKSLLGTLLE